MSWWLRLSRTDVAAAFICIALVAGFTWFRWAALPDPDQSTDTVEATVESITYAVPRGRSGAQASASINLRLDDGTEIGVGRKMGCLPPISRGDRVRLIRSRDRAGRAIWSVAGEPCPEEIY